MKIKILLVLFIFLLTLIGISVANDIFKLFNLLPRDHTEISCTIPLKIGFKAFVDEDVIVIFKVFSDATNVLLFTSLGQEVEDPFAEILLDTNIMFPPPLIRVEMIDVEENVVLSKILLEPDCDKLVNETTFIYPPPNGCKLVVNPQDPPSSFCGDGIVQPPEACDPPGFACIDPIFGPGICNQICQCETGSGGGGGGGGGAGGGHTRRGWPTFTVAVDLAKEIGKNVSVVVKNTSGNVLAQSDEMMIETELISMNLQSVSPFPLNSFFDVFFEVKIDNVTKTKAACKVVNGATLECGISCGGVFSPVCGADGRTYSCSLAARCAGVETVQPSSEICDAKDNDCDGQTDEGCGGSSCATNADCTSGFVCSAGTCKKISGSACTSDVECASGFCTDSVCSNTRCGGICRRVDATGTCTNIPFGQDPDNECPGTSVCNGAGACTSSLNCNQPGLSGQITSCTTNPFEQRCLTSFCQGLTSQEVCNNAAMFRVDRNKTFRCRWTDLGPFFSFCLEHLDEHGGVACTTP